MEWTCLQCHKGFIIDRNVHFFLEHKWKFAVLECIGCNYQDVIVDNFCRHLHEHHPELPQDWKACLKLAEQPFKKVHHCSVNKCEFRTCQVRTSIMENHLKEVHGIKPMTDHSEQPPCHEAFVDVVNFPPTLFEYAQKFSPRYIGRIEGVRNLVAMIKGPIIPGVYVVSREGYKIGTILVERHPSRPDFKAEEAKQHFMWPRSRFELLDTIPSPWIMAYCVLSKITFEPGDSEICFSKDHNTKAVMCVKDDEQ